MLSPGQYIALYDSTTSLTLLNTNSRVELRFMDESTAVDTVSYMSPPEDESWALLDGVWRYTDVVTPGASNRPHSVESDEEEANDEAVLAPCAAGKYRHPLTNRCRAIESDAAVLVSCDDDEYRSPETNRCRKVSLASVSLAPCQDGYERNVETNRCRKIAAESELTPCQEGYERNPETNRCRKLVAAATSPGTAAESLPAAADQANRPMDAYMFGAAIVGLGTLYAVYEYRDGIARLLRAIIPSGGKK